MRTLLLSLALLALDPSAGSDDERASRELFAEVAARLEGVERASASYVQTRRSELLLEPLVSRGRLLHRREPATLVFEVAEPRAARIWVQDGLYQVYRPEKARAERFLLEANALWSALLSCFSRDVTVLSELFETESFERREGHRSVTLVPRGEKTSRHLRSLTLDVRDEDLTLIRLAYVDPSGDEVELSFSDYDPAPKLADPDAAFSLALPDGVRLQTVRVR